MKLLLLSFVLCILPLFMYAQHKQMALQTDSNLVFVEGGSFKIGDKHGEPDETPLKKIKLDAFLIGKYEVTNKEFVEFLNKNGNQFEDNSQWIDLSGKWNTLKCRIYQIDNQFFVETGYEDFPVNFVNWYGANAYCKWRGGRLPTEFEWEYVAKGGKHGQKEHHSEIEKNLENYAWFSENSNDQVHKRGLKKSNILGIFDLQGNVWEWCQNFYASNYYQNITRKNPEGPQQADFRVIRGGSWTNSREMLRVSNRNAINPNTNRINVGFRIVFDTNK
jgi:formylglycine-generating enzyme